MKCVCGKCHSRKEISSRKIHSPELQKWNGNMRADIVIAGDNGLPVNVATIEITGMPLLVEPWMLQRVLTNASKELTKYVANFDSGKTVN